MNSLTIPISDPAFENLKKSGSLLHFLAALLILINAFTHLREPGGSAIFFWTQLIVAADIFILVIAGRQILLESPRFNLFFRAVESLFFMGVGIHMLVKGYWVNSAIQFIIASGYFYILYCEYLSRVHQSVGFHHLGITVPNFPGNQLIHWVHISHVEYRDHEIRISTSFGKQYCLMLREKLGWNEEAELKEFCHHYLGS